MTEEQLRAEKVSGQARFQVENDRYKLQNEARGALLQGLAGLAVLVGAFLGWRQIAVSRESHATDRFIRAIDQMGQKDSSFEITLGGIYGLERVARDSPGDRRSIGEILTAYVRHHSGEFALLDDRSPEDDLMNDRSMQVRLPGVQAALTVLGRGRFTDLALLAEKDVRLLDFRRADLHRADLGDLNFAGSGMSGICLDGADLLKANLSHADMMYASLCEVIANGADFSGVWLHDACCDGGHFYNVSFRRAVLQRTKFSGANLAASDFSGAILVETDLTGANLEEARFDDAFFSKVSADSRTVWPEGFDPEAHGVIFKSD
ncbi:pentapeptide repeat-containing protein [Acrocarpospora phusangensis]|uniref:pentapeptide repeat-containing protein n=1 Tax=Acrocarpospora phusangensis TaxID=1070424 RepID=UPI00195287F2|nr:pentapeptide repeat-containing protein [Acrocarpospora phusangensis]